MLTRFVFHYEPFHPQLLPSMIKVNFREKLI